MGRAAHRNNTAGTALVTGAAGSSGVISSNATARGCRAPSSRTSFKDYEYAIRFFQVHQAEVGSMRLRLVKNPRFTQEALDELLVGLRGFAGQEMEVGIEVVDEIPLDVTGKRAPVVSDVARDFQRLTPG